MNVGDVSRMTSFSHFQNTDYGSATFGFKAGKGKVFVFMLMGVENKDGSEPLDLHEVMKHLGWQPRRQFRQQG